MPRWPIVRALTATLGIALIGLGAVACGSKPVDWSDGAVAQGENGVTVHVINSQVALGPTRLAFGIFNKDGSLVHDATGKVEIVRLDANNKPTPVVERAACLDRLADLLEAHRDELMAICVQEAFKTIPDALGEVREAADFCRYYAQQARQGLQIGSPEEVAWRKGYIDNAGLARLIEPIRTSEYGKYLQLLLDRG